MGTLIGTVLLACFALLLGWLWRVSRRAHLIEGLPAPDTSAVDRFSVDAARIYCFFSTHCGHCRAALPVVERLQGEFSNLVVVDIQQHPELARSFGVVATPSFIFVADGRVWEVILGAASETWLRKRLSPPQDPFTQGRAPSS